MSERKLIAMSISMADLADLDLVVDSLSLANRHLVSIAALRAGLKVLHGDPNQVMSLLPDYSRARNIRPRQSGSRSNKE